MVERYNQPALPSPLVGTPGVDPSAGKAAKDVADVSNKMVSEQMQYATQQFDKAQSQFAAAGHEAGAFFRRQHAMQAAQTQLAIAQAKPDIEQAALDPVATTLDKVSQLSQTDATAPNQLQDIYKANAQASRDALVASGKYSPQTLKHLLPIYDQQVFQHNAELGKQAPGMIKNNLEAGLNSAIPKAQLAVDNIDTTAAVPFQLNATVAALKNVDTVSKPWLDQAGSIPLRDQQEWKAKTENTLQTGKENVAAAGVTKMISGIVTTDVYKNSSIEAGLNRIAQVRSIVLNPEKNGLVLGAAKQGALLATLDKREHEYQTDGEHLIKLNGDTQLARDDADVIQPMLEAEQSGNTDAQFKLSVQINQRKDDVNNQLKQAEKLPDSGLKQAQIATILARQNKLNAGTKGLIQATQLHNSQIMQQLGLDKQDTGNRIADAGMQAQVNDKLIRQMHENQTLQTHLLQFEFVNRRAAIAAMPLGPARTAAVNEQIKNTAAFTNWAVARGTMSADQADSFIKEYAEKAAHQALFKNDFFGNARPQLGQNPSQKQKDEAGQAAAKEVRDISNQAINDTKRMRSLMDSVGNSSLNAEQQVAAQSNLIHKFFQSLDTKRKNGMKPQEEDAWASQVVSGLIKSAQQGKLPEQLQMQQLQIRQEANKKEEALRSQYIKPGQVETPKLDHSVSTPKAAKKAPANSIVPPPPPTIPTGATNSIPLSDDELTAEAKRRGLMK
jgi:hypothetical protein